MRSRATARGLVELGLLAQATPGLWRRSISAASQAANHQRVFSIAAWPSTRLVRMQVGCHGREELHETRSLPRAYTCIPARCGFAASAAIPRDGARPQKGQERALAPQPFPKWVKLLPDPSVKVGICARRRQERPIPDFNNIA